MSLLAPDPFGATADPETYMPRAATERALAELERALLAGDFPVVLTGPAGIGKTLLLRVAGRRLEGRVHCVYIAYAALSAAELCTWILGLLGESAPANSDAQAALLAAAHRFAQGGTPLALLIDDASAVPPDTAERMRTLAAGSRGALQIVAADMEDASSEPWVTRFGTRVERVRLEAPMSAAETALYIRARLERGGISHEHRARLDAKVIDRIFRRSSGVPRIVQALASEFLRVGEAALPREALEALLAQEDAAELAARVAANTLAREALPAERTVRREAATPSAPLAPALIPSAPEKQPVSLVPRPSTPSPSQPRIEPLIQEPLPVAAPAASMPAEPTPEPRPRERASPPPVPARPPFVAQPVASAAASMPAEPTPEPRPRERVSPPPLPSRSPLAAQPVKKREPVPEKLARALHWQRTLIVSLGLACAFGLAIRFLRSAPVVPEPPVQGLDAGSPGSAKVPASQAAGNAPPTVAASQPPQPKVPESPRASQPASEQPVAASGSDEPKPSSPSAPLAAQVPVAPIPVHINATPWATIEVDGVEVGETPIAGVPLAPGNHVFRARMPNGRVIERTVQIGAGTRHVTFE
ncbi:MAG TPA: AAA family ATPase [Myxococcota bacterium]|nr:AAA family ATPase [Myxococcota bacterium]